MRRISLALALIGAVGCGQTSTSNTGGGRGTGPGTFTITIQNGQGQLPNPVTGVVPLKMLGGAVTAPGGINCFDTAPDTACSVSYAAYLADGVTPATVTLTAVPAPPVPPATTNVFLGWAGDCSFFVDTDGVVKDPVTKIANTCTLTGPGDKYVLAMFGPAGAGNGHPNWSAGALHGPQYFAFAAAPTTFVFKCNTCHGANLTGLGLAPSCGSCHAQPSTIQALNTPYPEVSGSKNDGSLGYPVASGHWAAAGHNSGTSCPRCHTTGGLRDYLGLNYDGTTTDDHLLGYVNPTPGAAKAGPLQGPAYGRPVNDTAHPTYDPATQPIAGTYYALGDDNALGGTNGPSGQPQNADFWAFTNGFACDGCHNPKTSLGGGGLNAIAFPSFGLTPNIVRNLDGVFALCGQCHTTVRDDRNIATLATQLGVVTDPDAQLAPAGNKVVRPHYLGAASTFLGSEAAVYAQYGGTKVYTARNEHGGLMACTTCHDAHTGQIVADTDIAKKCGICHFNDAGAAVSSFLELEETRQFGFEGDIDRDGNTTESLKAEIDGQMANFYAALKSYGLNVGGKALCVAAGNSGLADSVYIETDSAQPCGTKGVNDGAYLNFTARSLRASFNYMAIVNDPGRWAHNPRYVIELIFDSIEDLNAGLVAKSFPALPNGMRTFEGHFGAAEAEDTLAGGGAAFSDWDPGPVPNNCSQCHAGKTGIEHYLANQNTTLTTPSVTGMQCLTCHNAVTPFTTNFKQMRQVQTLNFPPRKAAAKQVSFAATIFPTAGDRVCATCHAGRENGISIADKISSQNPVGAANWNISFTNPHYLGAAGMMLGNDAKMMYQYAGKTYSSKPVFWGAPYGSPHGQSCQACHNPQGSRHSFEIDIATTKPARVFGTGAVTQTCKACHDLHILNGLETAKAEVEDAALELYGAIKTYSQAGGHAICYSAANYPYWFLDNGNTRSPSTEAGIANDGICQADELDNLTPAERKAAPSGTANTQQTKLNPKGSAAAFNYKWTQAEPGAWAHNEFYVMQVIYDTIVDLGGTPTFKVCAVKSSGVCVAGDPLNRGY